MLKQKLVFVLLAWPALLRAGIRLSYWEGRSDPSELPGKLCQTPLFRLRLLRNPGLLEASARRLLPLLPPWHHGRCVKHSLLLLDLWSRCGLRPRLHFGVSHGQGPRRAHAWVTATRQAPPSAYLEVWSSGLCPSRSRDTMDAVGSSAAPQQ